MKHPGLDGAWSHLLQWEVSARGWSWRTSGPFPTPDSMEQSLVRRQEMTPKKLKTPPKKELRFGGHRFGDETPQENHLFGAVSSLFLGRKSAFLGPG